MPGTGCLSGTGQKIVASAASFARSIARYRIKSNTREVEVLFHPRRDRWADHFRYRGAYVQGLTASGRNTVAVLALNDARRVELRKELLGPGG
jgi:hypothetical protein